MNLPGEPSTVSLSSIAVLIPAWQPEPSLVALALALRAAGFGLIQIVDDGSSAASQPVFTDLIDQNFAVFRHGVNLGKGRALKNGFNEIATSHPEILGIVTADADGQHTSVDIIRTAQALAALLQSGDASLILGARKFDTDVPLRSRFGNSMTRVIFSLVAGTRLRDTQTGLRGFPSSLIPELLRLDGERYEYEMNVLAHMCRKGKRPVEVSIETVYIDSNRSSHFNPIWDSGRIYFVLSRYVLSSIVAAALDVVLFVIAFAITKNLVFAVAVGRISSLVNFTLNRRFVFRSHKPLWRTLAEYYLLAFAVALASYTAISATTRHWHWNVLAAKLAIDAGLSLFSFSVQRTFIFRRGRA